MPLIIVVPVRSVLEFIARLTNQNRSTSGEKWRLAATPVGRCAFFGARDLLSIVSNLDRLSGPCRENLGTPWE